MHVCFVRQVRLEPEAVKLRCLVLRGLEVSGEGAKHWENCRILIGQSQKMFVLQ